ncbi:5-oxoprolinase subunit B family protein [Saccharopolyspora sp. NPDC000995]
MAPPTWQITDFGDSAVLAKAVGSDPELCWQAVQHLADALEPDDRVSDLIATYDSLLVEFDCDEVTHTDLTEAVHRTIATQPIAPAPLRGRAFRIPVVFGGTCGPDLPAVAEELGITEQDVVDALCSREFPVRFLGAPAGAPMLDGTPFAQPISRCPQPRVAVEPGSVALSGHQAVIYPVRSPGGWRLIGRTPLTLVDIADEPYVPYQPGDRFRFVPIDADRWSDCAAQGLEGEDA